MNNCIPISNVISDNNKSFVCAGIELGRHGNLTLEKVERFALAFTTTPKNLMKGIWF